jgi:hypothetical protein
MDGDLAIHGGEELMLFPQLPARHAFSSLAHRHAPLVIGGSYEQLAAPAVVTAGR